MGVLLTTVWFALGTPGIARAQDAVERGWASYGDADFEGALAAFDEAERSDDLDRTRVIRLLEGRACAHFALGRRDAMRREVARLASLAPDHEMGEEIPPDVREAFARAGSAAGEPLRLDATAAATDDGVRVEAAIAHDPTGLVREVHVEGRVDGGDWQAGAEGRLALTVPPGGNAEWLAAAIGPGGAILARAGSREAPQHWTRAGEGDGDGAAIPWVWIGAGAAGVVAGVVLIAVIASSGGERFDVGAPTVVRE